MSDLGLLEFGDGAGCACKADWELVELIRLSGSHGSQELGLLDASVIATLDSFQQVSSVDFIGPIARDAEDYGAIAAAHALSDLYAVGARPKTALVIAAWPKFDRSAETLISAVNAMRAECLVAGCEIVGGHTAFSEQPLLGMCVIGETPILEPRTKARAGDAIYITKPIGSGIVVGAVKENNCEKSIELEALTVMRRHNAIGIALNQQSRIRIVTDITGYGLCGQLSRLAEVGNLAVRIEGKSIPLMSGVADLVAAFAGTHAAEKNLAILGKQMACESWTHSIVMCDPQTNGPLLFVCDPEFDPTNEFANASDTLPQFFRIGELVEGRHGANLVTVL